MNNDCCGSHLHHTGACCMDEIIVEENKEVQVLKDCACQGLGPCQCDTKEQNELDSYEELKYVPHSCECGGNCGC